MLTLAAASVVGVALAGGGEVLGRVQTTHTGHGGSSRLLFPGNTLAALKGHAFDLEFTGQMLAHHQMAVAMAQHELEAGKDARVRAAARQVIADQMKEISLMRGWAKAWNVEFIDYGAVDMNMPQPGQVDHWFLTEMLPHHRSAVDMAKLVPARSQNPQVRQLAAQIVKTQAAEIEQYRAWLKALP